MSDESKPEAGVSLIEKAPEVPEPPVAQGEEDLPEVVSMTGIEVYALGRAFEGIRRLIADEHGADTEDSVYAHVLGLCEEALEDIESFLETAKQEERAERGSGSAS